MGPRCGSCSVGDGPIKHGFCTGIEGVIVMSVGSLCSCRAADHSRERTSINSGVPSKRTRTNAAPTPRSWAAPIPSPRPRSSGSMRLSGNLPAYPEKPLRGTAADKAAGGPNPGVYVLLYSLLLSCAPVSKLSRLLLNTALGSEATFLGAGRFAFVGGKSRESWVDA